MPQSHPGFGLKKPEPLTRLKPHVWVPHTVSVTFDTTFIKIDRVRGTVNVAYSDYRRN